MADGEHKETFVVDDDKKAEWALLKIKELLLDTQRYIEVCDAMIEEYEQKKKEAIEKYDQDSAYFKHQLAQYFETVDKKKTKTQETYKLPSGVLRRKYPAPQFKRNDKELVEWLKASGKEDLIKVNESADWANLKKSIQVQGDMVVTEDGEIVEGVEVIERPPTFVVEVEE